MSCMDALGLPNYSKDRRLRFTHVGSVQCMSAIRQFSFNVMGPSIILCSHLDTCILDPSLQPDILCTVNVENFAQYYFRAGC